MWQQDYTPWADRLDLSALAAALPLLVVMAMLGIFRRPSWQAAIGGLLTAIGVAAVIYRTPASVIVGAVSYGAAFGLFPISWIVFWAIVLYRLSVITGKFAIIQDSVSGLTTDRRLQALLVAFAFGAFIEGAAGFGAPVAVAASMLIGLGFPPFWAAGICLLANTAPVAFGSIGIPLITLAATTGLPLMELSAAVGKICAPISLFVPAYVLLVVGGWRGLKGVWPAAAACGISFALTQYLVSTYMGPYLTDIASSLAAIGVLVVMLRFYRPSDDFEVEGTKPAQIPQARPFAEVALAWAPYLLVVVLVAAWGSKPVKQLFDQVTMAIQWPGLHLAVERVPPVVPQLAGYAAIFKFDWLAASGTAMLAASLLSAMLLGVRPSQFFVAMKEAARQLTMPTVTICCVLGLAFLMNYSGATATLGLAFAATGTFFPLFSALLGWLGVFITGSDTSANALFGNLQVVTANKLGLDPVLMAAANSSGGVMGKMISLQSIAVAAAATGLKSEDESRMFRFTFKHSVALAVTLGLVVLIYARWSQ
jgi:L-lactate transport